MMIEIHLSESCIFPKLFRDKSLSFDFDVEITNELKVTV